MLPWIASQTVTRLRAGTVTDDYNNTVADWGNPASLVIDGCSVQFSRGVEFGDGRTAVVVNGVWRGPEDADVLPTDRLVCNGVTYEVDGPVVDADDPTGALSHRWCQIRRADG